MTFEQNIKQKELGLGNNVAAANQHQHAFVYLDTIGINKEY